MLSQLVRDAAVVLSVVLVVNYLKSLYAGHLQRYEAFLLGFTYAFAGVFSMDHPYILSDAGVQFDPRAVFVGLGALFGGWVGASIAGAICILYRLHLGGLGAVPGAVGILLTASTGVGVRYFFFGNNRLPSVLHLIAFALVLTIVSLATLLHLPGVSSSFSPVAFSGIVTALYLFICLAFGIFEVQEIKRRRREKALKESQILFESAQAIGQIGVLMYLPEKRSYRLSSQLYRMMAIDPKKTSLSSRELYSCVHADDLERVRNLMEKTSSEKATNSFQFRIRQPNGSVRIVWAQLITAYGELMEFEGWDREESGTGIAWLLHDVTERSQLFDQLAHSAKLASIGELASTIGHEINNPLTSSILLADCIERRLRQRGIDDPDIHDLVARMNQRLSGISSLIRSMTSFARLESTSQKVIDAHGVIMDTVGMFRELVPSERLEIEIDLLADQHQIIGASSRLQQVLLNLLTNAKDATTNARGPLVRIETREEREQFVIRIVDNGAGMTEDVRRRLFEPFFTTKERGQGTGLGLSIASSIVSHMKGRIEVNSVPRQGAEFRLTFPIANS